MEMTEQTENLLYFSACSVISVYSVISLFPYQACDRYFAFVSSS